MKWEETRVLHYNINLSFFREFLFTIQNHNSNATLQIDFTKFNMNANPGSEISIPSARVSIRVKFREICSL